MCVCVCVYIHIYIHTHIHILHTYISASLKDGTCKIMKATFNNNECENNYNNIYHNEPKLNKKNGNPWKTFFLDLSIEVHDRELTTEFLDKRVAFLFISTSYPISIAIHH